MRLRANRGAFVAMLCQAAPAAVVVACACGGDPARQRRSASRRGPKLIVGAELASAASLVVEYGRPTN